MQEMRVEGGEPKIKMINSITQISFWVSLAYIQIASWSF